MTRKPQAGNKKRQTDQPSDEPGRQPHEAADIETPPEAPEPTEPTDATDVPEIPNTEEGRDTGDAFSEPVTEYTEPNATEPATETQGTGEVLADGTVYAEIVDDMPSEGRPAEVGDPDFGPVEEAELVEPGTEPWLDGTPETPEASEPKEASGPHEIIDAEEVEEVYDDASETPDAQEAFAIGDGREAQEADEVEEAQEVPETAEYTEPSESASEGTAVSEEELAPEALAALLKEGAEREETYDDAHAELTEHIEQAEEAEPGAEVLDTEAEAGVEAAEVDEAAEVPVESDTAEEQVAAEEVPAVEEAAVEANEEAAEDAKARTREASEAVAEAAEQAEEAPVFTEQQQVPPEQAEKPANAEGGEQTETSDATDEDAETSEDTEGSLSPEAQALLEHLPEGTRELVVDLINEYGVNPEQAIRLVLEMRERLDDPSEATDRPTEANDKADEYNDMWAQRNHTGTPFGWNQPDEGRPVVRKIGQAAAAVGRFLWGATKFIGITAGSEVIGGGAALTQKIKVVGTPEFTRKSLFGLLPDRYRVTITNGSNTSTVEVGADDAKDATAKVESYGIGRARIRAGKKLN